MPAPSCLAPAWPRLPCPALPCRDDPETLREQLKEVLDQEQAGKMNPGLRWVLGQATGGQAATGGPVMSVHERQGPAGQPASQQGIHA